MHASELPALVRPPVEHGKPSTAVPAAAATQPGGGWAGGRWERAPQGRRLPRIPRPAPGRARGGPSAQVVLRLRLPRLVGRGAAALPANQVVGPAAGGLAVEKLLHQRRTRSLGRMGPAGQSENGMAKGLLHHDYFLDVLFLLPVY